MEDSCAVIVLVFTVPKNYHRVACVLMDMSWDDPTSIFLRMDSEQDPSRKKLVALKQRLMTMTKDDADERERNS